MNTLDLIQGSAEWHEHRATHFNASDAPAMMGLSPYKTRSELLREMATGITAEIDPATQRRFDDGHRFEALARPVAEKIIGEALFPVVGYEGKLSASFDGLTMDESVCFEHKTLNAAYRDAIATGSTLPPALLVQIEQQLMLADATRCLFMASKWQKAPGSDEEPGKVYGFAVDENGDLVRYMLVEEVHCFVDSDPELRKALLQGWTQLAIDREAYVHVEQTVEPTAATIEALPALLVQVEGRVLATNLDAFKAAAQSFIDGIKTELVNDQDFADADKMVKFLKDGEDRLAQAKQHALAQTASIDELFRAVDAISEQMRSKRLALDRLVKAEKENRRAEIVTMAQNTLHEHYKALRARIGGNWMPPLNAVQFAEAVKGLKSLDSMRDKVSTALANAKIEANEIADTIDANRNSLLIGTENDTSHLFPDFAQVCTKSREDFAALHAMRIQQEAVRKEAEREKIRQEEAAKLTAQNQTQYEDQGGKADAGVGLPEGGRAHPEAADHFVDATKMAAVDENMIDDYIRLLGISAAEKKSLRGHLVKFESYRIKMAAARGLAAAA